MNHLARLRLLKSQFASHQVDANRLGKLRFSQAQLAIVLAQLVEYLLIRLYAIAVLNGIEMLQT